MRLSDFWDLVSTEFGAEYGRVLVRDLALTEFDARTAEEALADGEAPRDIWLALCRASDVPKSRWHGQPKANPAKGSPPGQSAPRAHRHSA